MAYHRARKTGISSDWDKFKRYRNLYSRSSKKAFFKEATDIKTNDPAKLWKTVKPKINPNSCNSISSIASGNITIDSSVEIAKHFARSFMITLFGFSLLPLMVCCNFVASHFKGVFRTQTSNLTYLNLMSLMSARAYLKLIQKALRAIVVFHRKFLKLLLMSSKSQLPHYLTFALKPIEYHPIGRLHLCVLIIKVKVKSKILKTTDRFLFSHPFPKSLNP